MHCIHQDSIPASTMAFQPQPLHPPFPCTPSNGSRDDGAGQLSGGPESGLCSGEEELSGGGMFGLGGRGGRVPNISLEREVGKRWGRKCHSSGDTREGY